MVLLSTLMMGSSLLAEPAVPDPAADHIRPDGVHVLDGSYVLDVGQLHVNITNHGLIGSHYTQTYSYSHAPSGMWPGVSGNEYLYGAGLWVGGLRGGQIGVTTGQPERELRPGRGILDTIYESRHQTVTRPWPANKIAGWRRPDSRANDDGDDQIDEDPLNGYDEDNDGLIDEDYGQFGDQMFTATMYDNTPLVRELYPSHLPLGLKVTQRAAAWEDDDLEDFIVLDYEITNVGIQEINDIYLGFYVDCDIQRRGDRSSQPDDLAGFFNGPMRGADGSFHRMQVAWMADGNTDNPLPGWIGCILLHHDTHFLGQKAPRLMGVNSFQIFATNARVIQNGEPLSDADRYTVMAAPRYNADRGPSQSGDLKFLISSGPFESLPVGETLNYRVALVMGNSKANMLSKALEVSQLHRGTWAIDPSNYYGGFEGRETKICLGDLPPRSDGTDPLPFYRADFMDQTCSGSYPVMGYPIIGPYGFFEDEDGRQCVFVNTDNCEECFRAYGQECTLENQLFWRFKAEFSSWEHPQLFTGIWGRPIHVPWVKDTPHPPKPPNMRLVPGPKQVEIFWDDLSEYDPDYQTGVLDFESYRIWRVIGWTRKPGTSPEQGPPSTAWGMIMEYDLANFIPEEISHNGNPLAIGRNTSLEPARYTPACLSDPRFEGLAEAMSEIVQADSTGQFLVRPVLRNTRGEVIPGRELLVPWETYPDVLDTLFSVTPREEDLDSGIIGKRAVNYYHHLDTKVPNGFVIHYSVVASDHQLHYNRETKEYLPSGKGIQSEPDNHFQVTMPGPLGQTVEEIQQYGRNIYAYPNPATREALAAFQRQPPSMRDPTGERIMFNNLPAAQNRIKIFTASGDHVATINHDGRAGTGFASWNLMSRNGQEVVSGIYIYSVESNDKRFEDFRGTFVLIR